MVNEDDDSKIVDSQDALDDGAETKQAIPGPSPSLPGPTRVRAKAQGTLVLKEIKAENLRGYSHAVLPIGGFSIVVGNNNQGKSSILRIADWLLNCAQDEVLMGVRPLSEPDIALLFPANQVHHRARRFTMVFRFDDARKARKYDGFSGGQALLRLSVEKAHRRARINVGNPAQGEKADRRAIELREIARQCIQFVLVPAARDARSLRFSDGFENRIGELFLKKFAHDRHGGTSSEYRLAKSIIDQLREMVSVAGKEISVELQRFAPKEMLASAKVILNALPEDVGEWLRHHIGLVLSTGDHDANHVSAPEVGNGLQSILDVALSFASLSAEVRQTIFALEEPETFLHPSAQRTVAQTLRRAVNAGKNRADVILTTHSPYFVDETKYGETILVRNHRFYPPLVKDSLRGEINSALMQVGSAEVFFGRGVLLVEGEGDRAILWTLLRRIRAVVNNPKLDQLVVHAIGGKTSLAPWWRLFASYGQDDDRPIEWLCLLDADAASGERTIIRSLKDAGLSLPQEIVDAIVAFGDCDYKDHKTRLKKSGELNSLLKDKRCILFSVDCEWASFGSHAQVDPDIVAEILGFEGDYKTDPATILAICAGSKVGGGKGDGKKKQPFRRQKLAEVLPLHRLPPELEQVIRAWMGLVLEDREIGEIFRDIAANNSEDISAL